MRSGRVLQPTTPRRPSSPQRRTLGGTRTRTRTRTEPNPNPEPEPDRTEPETGPGRTRPNPGRTGRTRTRTHVARGRLSRTAAASMGGAGSPPHPSPTNWDHRRGRYGWRGNDDGCGARARRVRAAFDKVCWVSVGQGQRYSRSSRRSAVSSSGMRCLSVAADEL